jgi:MFS family permease
MVIGGVTVFHEGGLSPVPVFVVIGVAVLALFVAWENRRIRTGKEPLIRPALLKLRAIRVGVSEMALLFLVQAGVMFVIPVYSQVSLEYNALQSGLVMLPLSLAVIVASVLVTRLLTRFSPRAITRAGFVALALGCFWAASAITPNLFELRLSPGLILVGFGIGLIMAVVQNLVLSVARPKTLGEVAGLARSLSYLGSSFGTAVAGAVLISVLIGTATTLTQQSTVLTDAQKSQVMTALDEDVQAVSDTQVKAALSGAPPEVQDEVVLINAASRDSGLRASMVLLGIVSLIAIVLSFRLPGTGVPPDPPDPEDREPVTPDVPSSPPQAA